MPGAIVVWHWLIVGVGLMAVELLLPGVVFLWLGIAALVTGVVVFWVGVGSGVPLAALLTESSMSWESQIFIFAVLALFSTVFGRLWVKRHGVPSDHPALNRRADHYIGRRYTLDAPVVNGCGRLRIEDSIWKISGDDLPAGTEVTVTGADGVILHVSATRGIPPG